MSEDNNEDERERIRRLVAGENDSSDEDPDYATPGEGETEEETEEETESEGEQEGVDRYTLEIEDTVARFRDENMVRHNVYPESDNDDEDVVRVRRNRGDRIIRRRGVGDLHYLQVFCSATAFKEAVLDHALSEGRNIKQNRWEQMKLEFKCAIEPCEWRVYCSINRKLNRWQVKKIVDVHSCTRNGHCEILTDPVIAHLFLDKIRKEPEYMKPKKIQEMIKNQWKLVVTRNQCQEARNKALRWIKKEYDDQFAHIRGYCEEIITSNPRSNVHIETIQGPNGEDFFDRFYVCFDILRNSWKETCRPLIGLDGTFLKNTLKGQLLVAMGRDACNKMYPIAWAVVKVENDINWLWFINLLKSDLDLKDGDGFIITSDRQKGLIKAVAQELPKAEHRKCVRHIYGNLKARHGKKMEMKPFIWSLAWSYNEAQYEKNLQCLRDYDMDVYNDVMNTNPKTWCRAFFRNGGECCEDVENNTVESFNNTIGKARELPLMPMLELIRKLAMKRISIRQEVAAKHLPRFTPYVQKVLDEEHEDAADCTVWPGTSGKFEVEYGFEAERVDMTSKTCTCRKWDLTGIPCEHAYAVILERNLNVDDYVSDWFLTTRWRSLYKDAPNPMRGAGYWATRFISLVDQPFQPPARNKKQRRIKGKNESPSKKKTTAKTKKNKQKEQVETDSQEPQKRTMHCKNCGGAGHNKRSCAKRKKRGEGEASCSQVGLASGSQMEE